MYKHIIVTKPIILNLILYRFALNIFVNLKLSNRKVNTQWISTQMYTIPELCECILCLGYLVHRNIRGIWHRQSLVTNIIHIQGWYDLGATSPLRRYEYQYLISKHKMSQIPDLQLSIVADSGARKSRINECKIHANYNRDCDESESC